MIDILCLDEADRMIEDGHFKELKLLLDFIYNKRVEYKKQALSKFKVKDAAKEEDDEDGGKRKYKEEVLKYTKKSGTKDFMIRDIETSKLSSTVDLSKVVDLFDEEGMLEEITPDQLVIEVDEKEMMTKDKAKQKTLKRQNKGDQQKIGTQRTEEEEEKFAHDYKKMGGIQHIICSATMTIDNSGRITPKMMKKLKKNGLNQKTTVDTLTQLCKTLKFRSKNPKVIDLTENNEEGSQRMPDTLIEKAIRCKKEEKDLYAYYFLREHHDDATIIFCNSITCVRRLTSLLAFLKVPN